MAAARLVGRENDGIATVEFVLPANQVAQQSFRLRVESFPGAKRLEDA